MTTEKQPERLTENAVIAFIKRETAGDLNTRVTHVESVTSEGLPDLNICTEGIEFWIEIKCPRPKVNLTTSVFGSEHKIGPMQFVFFKRSKMAGGLVFLLVCNNKFTYLADATKVTSEIHAWNVIDLQESLNSPGPGVFFSFKPLKSCFEQMKQALINYCCTEEPLEASNER